MITTEFKKQLESEGYMAIMEVEGRGVCAIQKFLFTYGLVFGIDSTGYKGRYCYRSLEEATVALAMWKGTGDPQGNWIKYKGEGGERSNPNLI